MINKNKIKNLYIMVKIIFPRHQLISLFIEKPSYNKNFKSTK